MPKQKTTPEEIIRKSIKVFRRQGYYRTSMADLSKATGLTKGAFYHHFPNKEAVMKRSLAALAGWFDYKIFSIAYDEDLPGKERLMKMADLSFDAFTQEAGGCFFANTILETAHVEDTFLEEIQGFFSSWENALRNIFKENYNGQLLETKIQQAITSIEGAVLLMQLHRNPQLLRDALDRTIEML